MKRLSISILSLLFLLGACDLLDNQEPQQSVPLDEAYDSLEDIESALTGAYSDIQAGPTLGANYLLFAETMADNVTWQGSFTSYSEIANHDISVSNVTIEDIWEESYESINDVNLIIEAIDSGGIDAEQATLDQLKGEAFFIRAAIHFEAVRYYAKPWGHTAANDHTGIPIATSGVVAETDFQDRPRNTVAEVYNQVISDFQQATNLLPASTDVGRANSLNAQAYLARVYLQQGNYSGVESLTDAIISANAYQLESEPAAYFRNEEQSSESVFDIVHTEQDNPGVNAALPTFYADAGRGGRGDITIAGSYLQAVTNATASQASSLPADWSYEDLRNTTLLEDTGSGIVTLKYPDGTNTADNAPVIRFSDVLLMNAEAVARQAASVGDAESGGAIDLLNQVRLRSIRVFDANGAPADATPFFGYSAGDFADVQELIDAILLERRVELGMEGQRKNDLQRLQMNVDSDAWNADNVVFPIPQSELDANPNITQNPGY